MCVCPDLPCVEYNKWKGGLFLKYRRSIIIYITIDSWIHGVTRLLKLSCKQHNATCFIGSKLMSDYEKSDKHTGFFARYSVWFTCVPLISIPFILLRLHMSKNVKETWCCCSVSRCSYRACIAACIFRGKVARTVNLSWAGVVTSTTFWNSPSIMIGEFLEHQSLPPVPAPNTQPAREKETALPHVLRKKFTYLTE